MPPAFDWCGEPTRRPLVVRPGHLLGFSPCEEPRTLVGMMDKTDNGVVVQVAQRVENLRRAVFFYQRLLGQPADAVFDPPGLAFFVLDGVRLLLDREASSSLVYLRVGDVRTRVAELRADGVIIEGEPAVIYQHEDATLGPAGSDEWMAFVRDSEGNTVGLVSHTARVPAPGRRPTDTWRAPSPGQVPTGA